MSIKINSVEDHKQGSFYVDVRIVGGAFKRLSSMMEAMDFIHHAKSVAGEAEANIELKEVVVMPTKLMVYESAYCL